MQVFENTEGMYQFTLLPSFARYILEHHLVGYIKATLKLSRELNLPMLRHLSSWTDENLIEYSKTTAADYLACLAENKAKEQIQQTIERWLKGQLHIINNYNLAAEDITQIVHIRSKVLKSFIRSYATDVDQALALVEEIDRFNLGEITSATNAYINILKQKIDEEVHFNSKLVNTSPGMVYVYDITAKKLVYANNKSTEILGYSSEDLQALGNNFIEKLCHPDDLPGILAHFEQFYTLKESEVCTQEYRLRASTGEYRWIRNYETIFKRNGAKTKVQIIGAAYDISKEKSILEGLELRKAQLVEAQSIANIGSFEWDFVHKKARNTEQFYKIFEYDESKRYNEFIQYVHPDDRPTVETAFKNALHTGNYECEYRYLINDKEKYIWSRGFVTFENDQPQKMIGTVQDITVRRKIEEALLQKTIELQKSNADLTEFTYVASHDLKEPLRKIALYIDMIRSNHLQVLNEKGKEQFEKIADSARRMQTMIDDILSLSSVSAQNKKEDYSLQLVLEETQQMLEHRIKELNATIQAPPLPHAYIIPALFRQLFLNIISNALKFAREDTPPVINIAYNYLTGRKTFTLKEEEACYLQLAFSDNGIGFSNEFSDKIFQLFQRLHARTEYEGSGLGLAIVKRIVEEHKGTITASSEPGKGATFIMIIPVQAAGK